ncbi:hypothetical protein [Engelhardtia mirabilis]|uniref:Uncharacterized protein n=1 Tax=Engelhardtia mirabilis TaxID=2528011 RepID=A0A518BM82_9BACT|nr:hypothetical protein Pla133_31830 [Planctomycetes bacterium Pla133]QDV02415.1 hypothetical protein Pla86_31820 [Planctomycetes bacterium Pla86]
MTSSLSTTGRVPKINGGSRPIVWGDRAAVRSRISNFLPTVADAGYMETFMGWELICRDERDLAELASTLAPDEVARTRVHADPFGVVAYLEVERRG